jgi:hypothetical protein
MSKRKPYKRYSPEFKREALKRASEEGVTDRFICKELEISGFGNTRSLKGKLKGGMSNQLAGRYEGHFSFQEC